MKHVHPLGQLALVQSLAWLRLCAISGQTAAVLICNKLLDIQLPILALSLGIGALALFALYVLWRIRQPWPISEWESLTHVLIDTLVLCYLLYLTGGAENPFVTLLLVPIALSATAISISTLLCTGVAILAYLTLLVYFQPLSLYNAKLSRTTLLLLGETLNFTITATLLARFTHRLCRSLSRQYRELRRNRERALRDEGILAIATQAAGAAHELNTPLSTMRTLLPELRRAYASDAELALDLQLLEEQVDRCRNILREMVAFGQSQLTQEPHHISIGDFVQGCLIRFDLLRPEAELTLALDESTAQQMLDAPPDLRYALINLLNNAVDASSLSGSRTVHLAVHSRQDWLELIVTDNGPGFSEMPPSLPLGRSGKKTGLGLGMTLTRSTVERLDGTLSLKNHRHGAEVALHLPLMPPRTHYRTDSKSP